MQRTDNFKEDLIFMSSLLELLKGRFLPFCHSGFEISVTTVITGIICGWMSNKPKSTVYITNRQFIYYFHSLFHRHIHYHYIPMTCSRHYYFYQHIPQICLFSLLAMLKKVYPKRIGGIQEVESYIRPIERPSISVCLSWRKREGGEMLGRACNCVRVTMVKFLCVNPTV